MAVNPGLSLLDENTSVAVRALSYRAASIVEGALAGLHKSPFHGFSTEFREYRAYQPGESTRMIDWRKLAKSDRTLVRLFDDETNTRVHLIVDKSGSMQYAGAGNGGTKFEYAVSLIASLAFLFFRQRDAVGMAAVSSRVEHYIRPSNSSATLKELFRVLSSLTADGQTAIAESLQKLAPTFKKRGVCFLATDFFEDFNKLEQALRITRYYRQELVVLWIRTPEEKRFASSGPLRLKDAETGSELSIGSRIAGEHYNTAMAEHEQRIERACRSMGIRLCHMSTSDPHALSLRRILLATGKRSGQA